MIGGTNFEYFLEGKIDSGDVDGNDCGKRMNTGRGVRESASSIKLCGQCVGTDKLTHFFEEGLAYYDITQSTGSSEYAIAWGYWTEGIAPPNLTTEIWDWLNDPDNAVPVQLPGGVNPVKFPTGDLLWGWLTDQWPAPGKGPLGITTVVPDPNGAGSPADLAANESGLDFWTEILERDGGLNGDFNICDYVTEDWDHLKNPNVKVPPRAHNPPARPK
jgi:hypothetical protein